MVENNIDTLWVKLKLGYVALEYHAKPSEARGLTRPSHFKYKIATYTYRYLSIETGMRNFGG